MILEDIFFSNFHKFEGCRRFAQFLLARILVALILVVISRRCHDDENGFEGFEGVRGI